VPTNAADEKAQEAGQIVFVFEVELDKKTVSSE
jgi:hypothetical protein